MRAVKQALEAIKRGDIYQINLSRIIQAKMRVDPLELYVRVLKEQEQTLVDEIDQLRLPLMNPMTGLPDLPGRWSPRLYDQMVDDQLRELRLSTQQIEADSARLRADATRKSFLNGLRIDDPDEELDPFEAMLLEQELDEMMAMARATAAAPPGRRRRR
jgi:hypothetical protein